MPLCYGGGVTTIEDMKKIIGLGVEKVAISTIAVNDFNIIGKMSNAVGAQSVVVVLDVLKKGLFGNYELYTGNGTYKTDIKVKDFVNRLSNIEIGEIVINSINKDGTMQGYDYTLIDMVRELTHLPITVLGGAGSLDDIKQLIDRYKIIGAAAGSLFVFKGKYRAVLINYPTKEEKKMLSERLIK